MSTELTAKVWASQLAAGGKRSVVLGHQMLGVAHIIAENRPLLNSLTDPARTNADKQKLAREIFTGTADAAVVEQLCDRPLARPHQTTDAHARSRYRIGYRRFGQCLRAS